MRNRAMVILTITAVIAVFIILIVYSKVRFDIGVVCPLKEIFNWDCPGCGGTRMAESLLKLEIYQAFRYNSFVFLTAPILAYVYIKQCYLFIYKNELIDWLDKFLVIYTIGLFMFGVLRNTEAFSFLAPTIIK